LSTGLLPPQAPSAFSSKPKNT